MMKCIFGMQRNFKIFYKLILPFGFAYPDMAKVPKIRSLHVYAISPEKHGVELVKTIVFYKMMVFWICVTRLTQSTQNNKFSIYLQYQKESRQNEVDFLLAGKHHRFLQNDTIIFGVCVRTCPNYPK